MMWRLILVCILTGRAQQLRHWKSMRGPQLLPFQAIMTGSMAWKPSSDLFSIEGGWAGGCYLRYNSSSQLTMKLASFLVSARCLVYVLHQPDDKE